MFSLVDDPWIPAVGLDQHVHDISLRQALVDAHQYRTLATNLATESTAIMRLLLAILHTAIDGPTDLAGWVQMRSLEHAPHQVETYLDQWEHRLHLTGPEAFMQTPGLRTAHGTTGLRALVPAQRPIGSTCQPGPIDPAQSARMLVHLHAADVSGIKPGLLGDPETTAGKGMPRGQGWVARGTQHRVEADTLWHTLTLNAVPLVHRSRPVWEEPPLQPGDRHLVPAGRVALSTWPTRRVELITDEHTGMVTDAVIGQGDRIDVAVLDPDTLADLDPAITWRRQPGTPTKPRRMWTHAPAWWDLGDVRAPDGVPLARWLTDAPPTHPVTWVRTATDQGPKATIWGDIAEARVTIAPAAWTPTTGPVVDELLAATRTLTDRYLGFVRWVLEARGQVNPAWHPSARDHVAYSLDRPVRTWLAGVSGDPDQVRQTWVDQVWTRARELVLSHDLGPYPATPHGGYAPVQCQLVTLAALRRLRDELVGRPDSE